MLNINNFNGMSSEFVGGLFSGVILTLLLTRCFGKNSNSNKNDKVTSKSVPVKIRGPVKLILAVRSDLKMGKGKVAAQCAHSAVMAHEQCRQKHPEILEKWKQMGQPKIVVKIESEEEMLSLIKLGKENELLVNIVRDAGKTQVAPGSKTVLAVGPGPDDLLNKVTGHLKLY